ncbi:MAG: hypothetical protein QOJ76_2779, partial [Acidobacteriota bacterium]|nr:hypothetical protein [Acidobacteriota bacterium]
MITVGTTSLQQVLRSNTACYDVTE